MDRSGKSRSDKELIEAKEAIMKEMIKMKNLNSVFIFYPIIIDAIDELLRRREYRREKNERL